MNIVSFLFALILVSTSLIDASSSRSSSNGSSIGEEQSDKFLALKNAMQSFPHYQGLWQSIRCNENTEIIPEDKNPGTVFKYFTKDLEIAAPGLCNTLTAKFFAALGRAVAAKWVEEKCFTYDMCDVWSALVNSEDPEIIQFLQKHPIVKSDMKTYYYAVRSGQIKRDGIMPIRFDFGLSHHYKAVAAY